MNWIKVEDRLPEDEEVVLAFFDGFTDVFQYLGGDWYELTQGASVRNGGVTHWVAIEPPKK